MSAVALTATMIGTTPAGARTIKAYSPQCRVVRMTYGTTAAWCPITYIHL